MDDKQSHESIGSPQFNNGILNEDEDQLKNMYVN